MINYGKKINGKRVFLHTPDYKMIAEVRSYFNEYMEPYLSGNLIPTIDSFCFRSFACKNLACGIRINTIFNP